MFRLAQYRSGDLHKPEGEKVREHLKQCPDCSKAFSLLNTNASSYEAELDDHIRRLKQGIKSERRENKSPWYKASLPRYLSLAGAAAALVLVIWMSGLRRDGTADDVGFKGTLTYEVIAKRGQDQFRVLPGSVLYPDDALRFVITTDEKGYVMIFSVDSMKQVTSFYPDQSNSGGRVPVAIQKPGKHVMPGSVVLDDTKGEEYFFIVFSSREFNVNDVIMNARNRAGKYGLEGLENMPVKDGMRIELLNVRKKAL